MPKVKVLLGAVLLTLCWNSGPVKATTIGYWRFDEGTANSTASGANSVLDETSNSNDGTPHGDPIYSADVPVDPVPSTSAYNALSLQLNGNDYVSIPYSASLNPTTAFTVEFWMSGLQSQPGTLFVVVDQSHGWTDSTGWYFQGDSSNGSLSFGVGTGLGFPAGPTSTSSLLDNAWHHVAGTYDSSAVGQELSLYVDGVLNGVTSAVFASSGRAINIGASWGAPMAFKDTSMVALTN